MTRYEQGFMAKCAEYGVDARTATGLLEKLAYGVEKLNKLDFIQKMLGALSQAGKKGGKPAFSALRNKMISRIPTPISFPGNVNKGSEALEIALREGWRKAYDAAVASGKIKNKAIADALERSRRSMTSGGSYWSERPFIEAAKHNADVYDTLRDLLYRLKD